MIEKMISKAIKIAGSITKLAKKMGVTRQSVDYWRYMRKPIPYDKAIRMHVAVEGEVTVDELRPDMKTWTRKFRNQLAKHFIWGEKVGEIYVLTSSLRSTSFRKNLHGIEELAKSIDQIGMLHPVVVNRKMEVVSGERRLAAVKLLGHKRVLVRLVDISPFRRAVFG